MFVKQNSSDRAFERNYDEAEVVVRGFPHPLSAWEDCGLQLGPVITQDRREYGSESQGELSRAMRGEKPTTYGKITAEIRGDRDALN